MSIRKINRLTPLFTAAVALALSHMPLATAADSTDFLKAASQGGTMEVSLGSLAQEKAESEAVKQFGETMVNDHSKANEKLKELASAKDVTLPDELKPEQMTLIENLSQLSGHDFDVGYMSAMVEDHEKDVKEFHEQAEEGDDQDVKQFAAETVATLGKHLQMAKEARQQVSQ